MRKEEFMKQLETLLADISEEEKREALSYYWSYFDDAGEENEERNDQGRLEDGPGSRFWRLHGAWL